MGKNSSSFITGDKLLNIIESQIQTQSAKFILAFELAC